MPRRSLFSWLKSPKPKDNEQATPPPYTTEDQHAIKATDTPQWLWTNLQCREWIFAVCLDNLGLCVEECQEIADMFEGYGPSIYSNNVFFWEELFGSRARANAVFSQIFAVRNKKGALPPGITYDHFERAWAGGCILQL
jgi:hypothetical protein